MTKDEWDLSKKPPIQLESKNKKAEK